MSERLTPDQLARAVKHVLRVHQSAEAERRRRGEATDLVELRETMLECGLPVEDIERALADLPALNALRETRRRQWRMAGVSAVLFAVAIGGWLALPTRKASPTPSAAVVAVPRKAFISVRHSIEKEAPSHTWQDRTTLGGQLEDQVANMLRGQGYSVVYVIAPELAEALYPGKQTEPRLDVVRDKTGADIAILGDVSCNVVARKVFGTSMLSARAKVALKVVDLKAPTVHGQVTESSGGIGIDVDYACATATKGTMEHVLPLLTPITAGIQAMPLAQL